MASGQDALLHAANHTTQLGNRISLKMCDFLEHVKNQPLGFKDLGMDFLSICRILNALEESLNEHFSTGQPFPEQAIPELQRILDSTIQDFISLQSLLEKFMEYEKGGVTAKLQKTWRMFFADKDIAKVRGSLQESRGALNMTMLLTNINPNQITTPFGHEQSLLAARLAEHPSVSELDSASIATSSVIAPTVGSEDSDKIPIPSVSELQIHDDLIPVESERDISQAPPAGKELAVAVGEEPFQEPEATKKPEIIRVDRSTLKFRTPKSTQGAKSAALQKTLITAVESRKANIVEQLLDRGVPPDTGDEKNAVIIAAWNADSPTLSLLLEFGADPNLVRKGDLVTALRCACERRPEQAQMLLEWGADPNLPSPDWSPLSRANEVMSADIVSMLLKYGADPNLMDKRRQVPFSNACIRDHNPEVLLEYIAYGADVDMKNGDNWTALQAACCFNHPKLVKVLLENGADPNLAGEKLPLLEALRHPDCLKVLLENGADTSLIGSLTLAVAHNYPESVNHLLDHGVSPNEKLNDHYSPLSTACRENRPQFVSLLLSKGADPNMKGENWPLVMAMKKPTCLKLLMDAGADWKNCPEIAELMAWQNDVEGSKMMLATGVPVDTPHPGHGYLPLGTAVRDNHPEIVMLLLEAGADPNLKGQDFPLRLATRQPQFIKPLLEAGADLKKVPGVLETAVWVNNLEAVKAFIAAGVDVNESNEAGYLPLTTSIRDDHLEIFEFLIAHGADPNLRNREDPIMNAIPRGKKYLQPLLAAKADVQLCPKAVEYAVYHNNLSAIKVLVEEAGMDPNHPHPDGHFPLTTAVRDNHPEILRYLLSKKLDVSKVTNLVEYAVYRNHGECVKAAIEEGVDPNLRHKDGATPLTTAVREKRLEMLGYLLESGADPNALGQNDEPPIFMAAGVENPEFMKTLIEKGADVNWVREKDGQNALHLASWYGRMATVKALVDKGVDVNAVDKHDKAPMDYAAEKGHDEIVIALLESMG